jgi:histidine triad (HIT) family protein
MKNQCGGKKMQDCIFCKIAEGGIPCKKAYEDDKSLAFFDINPQAPVHILIIPKTHIPSVNALTEENAGIVSHLLMVSKDLAKEHGLSEDGYRLVINTGAAAGQTVHHIHIHLLGGRNLGWPPG